MPSDNDILFGELAIEKGYLKPHQVKECLDNQASMAEMGVKQPLGEIMVAKGYLTREAQKDVLREQQKRTGRHIVVGHYEMISKLGEGGMGAVYKAKVQDSGAVVAVKVLPKHLASDREYVTRFKREAEIASKLNHPNIVRTIEAGESAGYHYMAMELVDGPNLADQLKRERTIPEGEALHIIRDIAFALQHADASGLVHRDIKPANIFLARSGEVKLGDMGLAKETDAEVTQLTQSGFIVGTIHYVSPEQARGERDIDIRSDIYSLGATLYHILTGEVPFDGATPYAIINKHLTEELAWPADLNDELTDDACLLIQKMMAKDREDRYQTPLDLIHDIDLVIRGESPQSQMLSIGKSSIRKAVKIRKAAEAAERRRQRLEADAPRAVSIAGVAPWDSEGKPSGPNKLLLGVGVATGALMLIVAAALVLSSPGKSTDSGSVVKKGRKTAPPEPVATPAPREEPGRHMGLQAMDPVETPEVKRPEPKPPVPVPRPIPVSLPTRAEAEVQKLFHGKVVSYDPKTLEIELYYDFSSEEQTKDWKRLWGTWGYDAARRCLTLTGTGEMKLDLRFEPSSFDASFQTAGKGHITAHLASDGKDASGYSQKNCILFYLGHWASSATGAASGFAGCGRPVIVRNSQIRPTGSWQDLAISLRGNVFGFYEGLPRRLIGEKAVPEWKPEKFCIFLLGGNWKANKYSYRNVRVTGRIKSDWLHERRAAAGVPGL